MKRVFFDYVFKLFMVWLLVSCLGCASKKKNSSSEIELHTNTELQTSEGAATIGTNTNVVTDIKKSASSSGSTIERNYKPVDPSKPSSVTTPDGKKYVLDNAEVTEKETKQSKKESSEKAIQDTSSSTANYWGKDSSFIKLEDIHSTNNNSSERSSFNFWSWLWVLALITIVIILNYLNNRFKWISYVTSFFRIK